MKRSIQSILLSLHCVFAALSLQAQRSDDKTGLQSLHGSWVVAAATMNGKPARDASLLSGTWTFRGNELNVDSPQKGKARFALKRDPKAQAFQLTPLEPATEASGWMLFSREGANLKLAFYDNLEGRPEGFEPRDPRAKPELIVVTLSPKK
jgi:uncharacterized protein (TIGR03067 family)